VGCPHTPHPTPHTPAVRLGLRAIRGLGAAARAKLDAAMAGRPFTSVADVVPRTGPDLRALRLLGEAAATDGLVGHLPADRRRRGALWEALEAWRGAAGPLAPLAARDTSVVAPPLPPLAPIELTAADYRITALSLNGHPMRHLRETLAPNGVRTAAELLRAR